MGKRRKIPKLRRKPAQVLERERNQKLVDDLLAEYQRCWRTYRDRLAEYQQGVVDLNAVRRAERAMEGAKSTLRQTERATGLRGQTRTPPVWPAALKKRRTPIDPAFGLARRLPGSFESGGKR